MGKDKEVGMADIICCIDKEGYQQIKIVIEEDVEQKATFLAEVEDLENN